MNLNEIGLVNYAEQANEVVFVLNSTIQDVAALDGETLVIAEDGGEDIKVFDGYRAMSVGIEGKHVVARFRRALDDSTSAAINALDENVRNMESHSAEKQAQIDEIAGAIEELAAMIAELLAAPVDEVPAEGEDAVSETHDGEVVVNG